MMSITVDLDERSYPIYIGSGLLGRQGLLDPHLAGRDAFIVTNTTVGPLYLERLVGMIGPRGRGRIGSIVLPDGEAHKTMATTQAILDALVGGRFARDCVVLALGGGVVGDITGFAAAIYQRGVDFIQVPTTLLAQVDSSVGGKTGINHPGGKNLVGAFHQPLCVVADSDSLRTLPDRELSAGLAEVLKAALIADAGFFQWIEAHAADLLGRQPAALHHAIRRSCEIKAGVVAEDEREHGRRALLNLGHSFGHAIELCAGYGQWLHGEAVGAGMGMAARFSQRLGWLPAAEVARITRLLEGLRLPVKPPAADMDAFLGAMAMDKKVLAGQLRLILLPAIGQGRVTAEFTMRELQDFVRAEVGS
ncbi:MAG: 3-dehydroquinate synthase [Gammaproteobacteria bacterium]|nr:3-dehydroquinate synthase [Gammaproteobacteria bacterium]